MKKALSIAILLVLVLISTNVTFALSADDFLPPADGGSQAVVGPVSEGEDGIIMAETAQDAFNHANNILRLVDEGFQQVSFGSGLGYIAGATATYETFENPNATQQSLRLAYVKAFSRAKGKLVSGLTGLSNTGMQLLIDRAKTVDLAGEGMANMFNYSHEEIEQVVQGLLRGYVVYEIEHRPKENTVFVSIATSLKTIAAVSNISGGVIQSASLNEGLDYVLKEITRGLVPPIGGKVISVPATGEVAVVAFGSDIIRTHENASMTRALRQASERAAEMRATDAMIGMLKGDEVLWLSGLTETQEQSLTGFEEVIDENNNVHYEVFDELQGRFFNGFSQIDDFVIVREGKLPPGVNTKLAFDDHWVYAISVYLPSMSKQAEDFYNMMQNPNLLPGQSGEQQGSGKRVLDKSYDPNSKGSQVQDGPSGKVSSPNDL